MKIKCMVCHKNTIILLNNQNYIIYRCNNCGLGFTKNIKKQTENYHRDEDYIRNQKQFENIYQKRVNIIDKFANNVGRALEIGSSTGLLLKLLQKKGWDILGVEVSARAGKFARKHGIPTLITSFEKVKLSKDFFDVIILNHTLEHLNNPAQIIRKINSLLVQNGIIFIDVPNFGGFSAKILRKNWPYLLPNEHYWHFTLDSLLKIFKRNNFKIIYYESSSGIWDYQNPWLELWQSFSKFKKRFLINLLTSIPTLIISKLNQGSGLIIVAQKNTK